jgi:hypothetical protein
MIINDKPLIIRRKVESKTKQHFSQYIVGENNISQPLTNRKSAQITNQKIKEQRTKYKHQSSKNRQMLASTSTISTSINKPDQP